MPMNTRHRGDRRSLSVVVPLAPGETEWQGLLLQLAAFTHLHEQGQAKRGLFLVPSIVQGQFSGEALRYLEPGKYNWHIQPGAGRASLVEGLAVVVRELRLVVERVDMRWSPLHAEEDHALGPRGEMRRPGCERTGGLLRSPGRESREGEVAKPGRRRLQQRPPGHERLLRVEEHAEVLQEAVCVRKPQLWHSDRSVSPGTETPRWRTRPGRTPPRHSGGRSDPGPLATRDRPPGSTGTLRLP